MVLVLDRVALAGQRKIAFRQRMACRGGQTTAARELSPVKAARGLV
jgi:hypothetical protein